MATTYAIGFPQAVSQDRLFPQKGGEFWTLATITWDGATYASGGVALTPSNFGVTSIIHVVPQAAAGIVFSWNTGTAKLQAWKSSASSIALTECVNTDLNTVVSYLLILAR